MTQRSTRRLLQLNSSEAADHYKPLSIRRSSFIVRRPIVARAILVSALLVAQGPTVAAGQDAGANQDSVAGKIDRYMDALVKLDRFSGAILVARDGHIVHERGYALANVEWGVPNQPDTRFRIGSLTKQFTATAILMLQEQGKLHVADRICAYIRPCPATWQPITIHELLTHTSGIPDYVEFPDFARTQMIPTTPGALVERFRRRPLRFVPGSRFEYSNSGYVTLGLIIERVSGESYAVFLRHHILDVLHLVNTGYDSQAAIIEYRAQGYVKRSDTLINAPPIDPSVAYAAGALYSTVRDLMTLDEALYSDQLISRDSRRAMFTVNKGVVGYGWAIGTLFNRRIEHHNGEISGFVSNIARFPDQHVLIVVLSNRDGTQVDNITKDLAAITFGESYELPIERAIVRLAPASYDRYVGTYRITADIELTISRRGDGLEGRLSGGEATGFRLAPLSEVHFVSDMPPVDILFALDPQGKATEVTVNGAYTGKRIH